MRSVRRADCKSVIGHFPTSGQEKCFKKAASQSGSNESDDSDVTICPPSTHLILSMCSSLPNVLVFGCVGSVASLQMCVVNILFIPH